MIRILFVVIASLGLLMALGTVLARNLVHAALYLVGFFFLVACQFVLLEAEFMAAMQVLVYIGAVVVLLLFGVMLTRAPIGREGELDNDQRWVAALVALFMLGALGAVLTDAFGDDEIEFGPIQRSADVGDSIFGTFVIPFEVVSVLLLAALVGAVALARRD